MPCPNVNPMRFQFKLVPTFFAVVGVVATILLGNWQTGRAQHKADLQLQIDQANRQPPIRLDPHLVNADSVSHLHVEAQGRFADQFTIFLDNRVRGGVAGYEVITPLILTGNKAVVIDRGWVATSPDRSHLPAVKTPTELVVVTGVALPPVTRFLELSRDTVSGQVWQNFDLPRYVQHTRLDLLPVVIQLQSELPDGLDRHWSRPDLGIDQHRAYALQWYSMSVAIVLLYFFLHVRRRSAP
jgi:surfeit locus 1 family protein